MGGAQQLELPMARRSDPETSSFAARVVAAGNAELVARIRRYVWTHGPLSAFEIAEAINEAQPGRWDEGTIRSAVSRSGLSVWPHAEGLSPRGRRCQLYTLRV